MYWLNRYKVAKGCHVCGYNKHAAALDFHHPERKNGRKKGVSFMKTHALKKLMAEVRKCEVICSNCHRIEHAEGT